MKALSPNAKHNIGIIVTLSVICAAAIGVGIPTGLFLGKQFRGGTEINYDNIQSDGLSVDYEQYYNLYTKKKNEGGNYLDGTTPAQVVNMAYALLTKQDHFMSRGYGMGTASIVDQEIRSCAIKQGDEFFEESLSLSSIVNVAWRMYEKDDITSQYQGKCRSGNVEVALFDQDKGNDYKSDEYIARMGRNVHSPTSYIITDDTVIYEEEATNNQYGISSVEKTTDGYVIDLEFNPVLAVLNYVVQMQTISDLPKKPAFVFSHFRMTTDLNLRPVTVYSVEKYYANTGAVGSYVTSEITTYYTYDGEITIPKLSTPIDYKGVQ